MLQVSQKFAQIDRICVEDPYYRKAKINFQFDCDPPLRKGYGRWRSQSQNETEAKRSLEQPGPAKPDAPK